MKKYLLLLLVAILVVSCEEKPKDYVTFSGKIINKNSDSLVLSSRKLKFKKVIKVDDQGVFKDTFKLKSPNFLSLFDGSEYAILFLRNGDEVQMTIDTKAFDESIAFEGKGSKESNFLAKQALMEEAFMEDDSLYIKSKKDLEQKMRSYNLNFLKELEETESKDSLFLTSQDKNLKRFKKYVHKVYDDKSYILKHLTKGTPAPEFSFAYENKTGGTNTMADFKGKYVLLNFWATWCGYCKQETPYLKTLLEEFKGKNLLYVGVSTDKKEKRAKWEKVVDQKALPGVQLFTNNDKDFLDKYRVSGIPRYVLIDPQGKIVEATAPKATDPKLKELLESLNL